MATSKPKFINFLTPLGLAVYPKLTVPDTKYKPLGEYSLKLKLTAEEAQPLIDQYESELTRYFDEVKAELMKGDGKAKAKAKALKLAADKPYKPEFDDEGEETGNIIFNYKMPARIAREGKEDIVLKPDVFNAGGKKMVKVPEIWSGSKVRVSGQLRPFNAPIGVGVSLRLQAVQLIELVQGGSRDAAGYGFGAEEGYEGDDEAAPDDGGFGGDNGSSAPADDNTDF